MTPELKADFLKSYDSAFHKMHFVEKEFAYQEEFGKIMCEMFLIKSVIDFGCGIGKTLHGAFKAGVFPLHGMEIALENALPYIHEDMRPFISDEDVADVNFKVVRYDCAWSFEVAEHILPETSAQFVRNLTASANRFIIFSAAPPGQGGVGHINCQEPSFWKGLFQDNGFKEHVRATKRLLSLTENINVAWYVRNNLMVFKNENKITSTVL